MKIANNILELIGNTPLLYLNKINEENFATIAVKLESKNPAGSVKDRLGYALIRKAEAEGKINSETLIIEPSSGNTGIGLAMACAAKSYKLIITMPESMSLERRKLIQAYGAEIVLTPAEKGMKGAIEAAEQLADKHPNSYIPQQFKNMANVEMHRQTTAEEIWRDTDGTIDIFVAGVGTGGTITGVSEVLKSRKPALRTVAVEPKDSAVISGKSAAAHKIQGIGAGFVPEILNTQIIDEIFCIETEKAFETSRLLATKEGIFCGISSGANVYAAIEIAKRKENKGKLIVTIICDTGERYLSSNLF